MPSIAKLNVMLTASTGAFEKAMQDAEKKLVGFAAKASQPFSSILGGGKSAFGAITGSAAAFGGPIGGLASAGGVMGHILFGSESGLGQSKEKMTDILSMVKEINKESRKFGTNPAFIRGLRLIDDDPAIVSQVMDKFNDTISKLRGGDKSLASKLGAFGIDTEAMKRGNIAGAMLQAAGIFTGLKDSASRTDFLGLFTGDRLADDALPFFLLGKSGMSAAMQKASGTGLYSEKITNQLMYLKDLEREAAIKEETGAARFASNAILEQMASTRWNEGGFGILEGAGLWAGSNFNRMMKWLSGSQPELGGPGDGQDSVGGAAEAERRRQKRNITDIIERLTEETNAAGKTADQYELLTLQLNKATEAQIKQAEAMQLIKKSGAANIELTKLNESLDRQVRLFGAPEWMQVVDRLRGEGASSGGLAVFQRHNEMLERMQLADANMSPAERYAKMAANIGRIGGRGQDRALDNAFDQAFGVTSAIGQARSMFGGSNARLALQGSQEAFALLDNAKRGDPNRNELVTLTQRLLEIQDKTRQANEDILREVRKNRPPAPALLPP